MWKAILAADQQPSGASQHSAGEHLFACVIVVPGQNGMDGQADSRDGALLEDEWLTACRGVTPAVERLSSRRALLDLGVGAPEEARAAMSALMERVARMGWWARVGIAPGLILAELTALMARPDCPLLLTMPDALHAFLRRVPVTALPYLAVGGPERVTPEMAERLERYGIRRLADLARLGELTLRRQFGAAGGFLAAVATGRDERPLHHTPAPVEWCVQLRLGSAVAPEHVLAALRPFAEWMSARLRAEGRQTRRLRVRLRWECGCARHAHLSMRQHTQDAAVLSQELDRVIVPLLLAHGQRADGDRIHTQALDGLWIAFGDFAPLVPSQATFWRTREQQLAITRLMAETLARRHGHPLLQHMELARPAAIYDEERHHLTALPAAEPAGIPRQQRRRETERPTDVPSDPWQTVPQRLHWW